MLAANLTGKMHQT